MPKKPLALILLQACAFAAVPAAPATPAAAGGSEYGYRIWRIEDGLPENRIRTISQTPDGYLWVGTADGLARFDGVRFTVFDRSNTPDLGDDGILTLRLASDGTLWIGTEGGGLVSYKSGVFHNFGPREGLTNGFVRAILEDSRKNLWIGTDRGFFWRGAPSAGQTAGGRFERIDGTPEFPHATVPSVAEDEFGRIQAVSPEGLLTVVNGRLEHANPACDTSQIRGLRSTGPILWAIGNAGAGRVKDGCVVHDPAVPSIPLRTIVQDHTGVFWIGATGHGLLRRDGNVVKPFAPDPSLPDDTVNAVFEDAEHNLWIGREDGLQRLARSSVSNVGRAQGLEDENVLTVYPDRSGTLWITTLSGPVYTISGGALKRHFLPGAARSIVVRTVFQDRTGAFWFGAFLAGVIREAGGSATVYSTKEGFRGNAVRQIAEDRAGNLWFALDGGISRWDGHAFRGYYVEDGIAYPSTRCLLADGPGDMLVGTDSGMNRVHNGEVVRDSEFAALAHEKIWALYRDAAGTLWIGTRGGGLLRFQSGSPTRFDRNNGLISNAVFAIVEDTIGNLWLSTSAGVVSVERKELDAAAANGQSIHVTPYGTADGMMSSQMNGGTQPAAARNGADGLWFASVKGAVHISSVSARGNPRLPLLIERITADSESFPVSGQVSIPPHHGRLQIDFTFCDLTSPQRVGFRYKLENFDENWIPAVRGRSANYTNVPPGNYKFHVVADDPGSPATASGNAAETIVGLTLEPAVYQTLWFYGLMALAAAGMVWGGFAFFARQTRARYSLLLAERTRLAREMHDTVIQGCVGVATLLEAAAGFRPIDPGESEQLVDQARMQATKTLEEAREAVWNLRHSPPPESAVNALFDLARQLGEERGIRIDTETVGSGALDPELDRTLLLIGREAIGNAVAHGRPSHIGVRLEYRATTVQLEVTDDGVGFDAQREVSVESRHFGLIGMRERAETAGGSFQVTSSPGAGAKVIATLPKVPRSRAAEP